MGFETAIRRIERDIMKKRGRIADWRERLARATDPKSRSSLKAHITRAERDIAAYEHQIDRLREAIKRGERMRRERDNTPRS